MKKTILLTFLTLFIFLITSCDKNKSETDNDIINDNDTVTDIDAAKDENASFPDEDQKIDEDTDIQPDIDTEEPDEDKCSSIDTYTFPFKDDKGNIHFCREGCDTPTANDPQCAANLWKEDNEKLCTEYPTLDCCNYPCNMDNLIPTYKGEGSNYPTVMECDIALNANNPNLWQTGRYSMKSFNFQEGKIGFFMGYVGGEARGYRNNYKAFEYDVKTKKYRAKHPAYADTIAYNKGKILTKIRNDREGYSSFMMYSNSGVNRVVYPKAVRNVVYTPFLTDKWAFVNLLDFTGRYYMAYALVKEHDGSASCENIAWNWINLGDGTANDPNIVDDRLVFYGEGFKGYICELDKEPKSLDECKLINRTIDGKMEEIRHPWIDKNSKDLIYFNPIGMTDGFMRLDTSKEPWEYKKFTVTKTYEDTYSIAIGQVKGNFISYSDIIWPDGDRDEQDNIVCMYRVDQEKSYCPADGDRAYGARSEFDGHYIAWQLPGNPELHLRDMECYCDLHPEVCPYDDYTPSTECPKNIKTGEHECKGE